MLSSEQTSLAKESRREGGGGCVGGSGQIPRERIKKFMFGSDLWPSPSLRRRRRWRRKRRKCRKNVKVADVISVESVNDGEQHGSVRSKNNSSFSLIIFHLAMLGMLFKRLALWLRQSHFFVLMVTAMLLQQQKQLISNNLGRTTTTTTTTTTIERTRRRDS